MKRDLISNDYNNICCGLCNTKPSVKLEEKIITADEDEHNNIKYALNSSSYKSGDEFKQRIIFGLCSNCVHLY